ncbi:hypothetical protein D3C81_636680 [compost metagenome]
MYGEIIIVFRYEALRFNFVGKLRQQLSSQFLLHHPIVIKVRNAGKFTTAFMACKP